MTEILSFPGLGLQFEINRVAFTFGERSVYWYGIIVAAAFLFGSAYVLARCKTFGLDGDRLMDAVLGAVILGVIGARAYYVVFRWDTYSQNPISALYVWEGGIAFYGGLIGGILGGLIVCRLRKVKILPALDVGMCGMLIGQAIGRWGNFVNIEAFGSNTTLPWGMTGDSVSRYLRQNMTELGSLNVQIDPSAPVHPTFLYESLWCILGFLFLLWFTKRRRFDGEMTLIYLCWNGLGRFFIEGLRTDSLMFGTMRVSQVLALLLVLACGVTLTVILSKIKRANDPEYLKLYVETDEGKAIVAGEFYNKKPASKRKPAENKADGESEADASDRSQAPDENTNDAEKSGTEEDEDGGNN